MAATNYIWIWSPSALRFDSLCPTLGQSTATTRLGCSQDLSSYLTQDSSDHYICISKMGQCSYTHRKHDSVSEGRGCLAPISATHLFCECKLFTLTIFNFPISNRETMTSACPSCWYRLPASGATSCWAHLLKFKTGDSVCGPKAFHVCPALTMNSIYDATPTRGLEKHLSWLLSYWYWKLPWWADGQSQVALEFHPLLLCMQERFPFSAGLI